MKMNLREWLEMTKQDMEKDGYIATIELLLDKDCKYTSDTDQILIKDDE